MLMIILSFGCNIQRNLKTDRDINTQIEQKENTITNAKVIEYDTARYFINDTIYQPVKKVTYINHQLQKESKQEDTLKEKKIKEEATKSEFGNYLIAFGSGLILMLLILIFIKLTVFYFKNRKKLISC